jgi:hypothetical protein
MIPVPLLARGFSTFIKEVSDNGKKRDDRRKGRT